MSIPVIGILTLMVGFLSLRKDPAFGYTFLICSMLLGSAAAMLVPGLGTIQPSHLLLGFIFLLMLKTPSILSGSKGVVKFPSAGFWLACTCLYGVASAFFFSRFFAGQVEINAVSTPEYFEDYFKFPLKPTNGNITQAVYFVGDMVCFILFYNFANARDGKANLVKSFLIYGTLNIAFAFIDLTTSSLNMSWLLEFIRNATYIVYADSAVGDLKRIIGSFSEASAFASATLGITIFSTRLWLGGVKPKWSATVAAMSIVLLLLSTSSTAYVALAPSLAIIFVGSIIRSFTGRASSQDATFIIMTPFVVATLVLLVFLYPSLRVAIGDYMNNVLYAKSLSSSGIDRARLNQDALEAFWATAGIGAGLGSIRTSSFVLAALSNIGLIGSFFYAAFLAVMTFRAHPKDSGDERHARAAARCGCFSLLAAATVSGALVDLGLPFFALAAFASAPSVGAAVPRGERKWDMSSLRSVWVGRVTA